MDQLIGFLARIIFLGPFSMMEDTLIQRLR